MAKVEREGGGEGRHGGIPPVTGKGEEKKDEGKEERGEEVKMSQGLEIKLGRAKIFSG